MALEPSRYAEASAMSELGRQHVSARLQKRDIPMRSLFAYEPTFRTRAVGGFMPWALALIMSAPAPKPITSFAPET